ncbi:electron transfer flavoprotein-ubiquinone oxidoreductase [Yunchengibacter salinarum]|uniref:electron transfer flavoprotein-ubiquinone oxidoreductase n=1 Tax=Yunchengibacter salinarum TaxID=3133399 RepID=UPI0035B65DA6
MEREAMEFDVVIVGGGVAGLAGAIRLMQQAEDKGRELAVCVLEKGSEVGAHILSGAVVDPKALNELLPDWKDRGAPLNTPVTHNHHWVLSETGKTEIPHFLLPPLMSNKGMYTVSLGNLSRWLAEQAEAMGVEVYPGFAAAEVLYHDDGRVKGVATGDMGVGKDGKPKETHMPGMELHAKYTLFAEGCRGNLTGELEKTFDLRADSQPQTYGIGIKELWDVDPDKHVPGKVIHTQGWPLSDTAGGGFIYHQENNQVAIGFVVTLDYENPYLSPFDEMQRFKTHPAIKPLLEGGRRVSYGARAINEGGLQSIPKLAFPGGALVGCAAGFVNVPRIKGSHNAMKSAMIAAETVFEAIEAGSEGEQPLDAYDDRLRKSWVYRDLKTVRNARPALGKFGITMGTLYSGLDMWLNNIGLGFLMPWTFSHPHKDNEATGKAKDHERISYPRPDGEITFDKLSSVFLSNTNHEEDQPCHLTLRDDRVPETVNWPDYAGPEQRYCPAGVYEYVESEETGDMKLQINAQNCVHCKTCDIKDMTQNIKWVVPEGGGGPNYPNM